MVQCEIVLTVVRERGAWNIVLKAKAVTISVKPHYAVQGVPPCPHINRYKAALVFREQPVCICGLSAHPYMTLRKKRWEVEVIGKSPLGYADPYHVLRETPLS